MTRAITVIIISALLLASVPATAQLGSGCLGTPGFCNGGTGGGGTAGCLLITAGSCILVTTGSKLLIP